MAVSIYWRMHQLRPSTSRLCVFFFLPNSYFTDTRMGWELLGLKQPLLPVPTWKSCISFREGITSRKEEHRQHPISHYYVSENLTLNWLRGRSKITPSACVSHGHGWGTGWTLNKQHPMVAPGCSPSSQDFMIVNEWNDWDNMRVIVKLDKR